MADRRLLDYIKEQQGRGVAREQIQKALLDNGWKAQDVNEAFDFSSNPNPNQPVQSHNDQPQAFSKPQARNFKKILVPTVIVIGACLLVGGGVFAYFQFFQSPEKVIKKMLLKLPEIKSFEYFGETSAEINR